MSNAFPMLSRIAEKCFGNNEAEFEAWWDGVSKELFDEFEELGGRNFCESVGNFIDDLRDGGVDDAERVALCRNPEFMEMFKVWLRELPSQFRDIIREKMEEKGVDVTEKEVDVIYKLTGRKSYV